MSDLHGFALPFSAKPGHVEGADEIVFISDARGSLVADGSCGIEVGRVLAAAPTMLDALAKIAALVRPFRWDGMMTERDGRALAARVSRLARAALHEARGGA